MYIAVIGLKEFGIYISIYNNYYCHYDIIIIIISLSLSCHCHCSCHSIVIITTIVFETNFSFHVKKRITGKV